MIRSLCAGREPYRTTAHWKLPLIGIGPGSSSLPPSTYPHHVCCRILLRDAPPSAHSHTVSAPANSPRPADERRR
jgi:hypothetical protein